MILRRFKASSPKREGGQKRADLNPGSCAHFLAGWGTTRACRRPAAPRLSVGYKARRNPQAALHRQLRPTVNPGGTPAAMALNPCASILINNTTVSFIIFLDAFESHGRSCPV